MAIEYYLKKYKGYECDELAELLTEPGIDHRIVTALIYLRAKAAEELIKEQELIDQMTAKYTLLLDQFEKQEKEQRMFKELQERFPHGIHCQDHCHNAEGHCMPRIEDCTIHADQCIDSCHQECTCNNRK
jgi:hypothetical protein